jgi:hypothetical protein
LWVNLKEADPQAQKSRVLGLGYGLLTQAIFTTFLIISELAFQARIISLFAMNFCKLAAFPNYFQTPTS